LDGKRGSLDLGELGESEFSIGVLRNLGSLTFIVGELDSLDDVEALMSSGVSTRDLCVKLGNGSTEGNITVLFVHVDSAGPGIVAEEDAEVLHGVGALLEDFAGVDDLTLYAADLVLALHVVPELGPGEHFIPGENADTVESGLGDGLRGQFSADNVELTNSLLTRCNSNSFDHFWIK
jgi:hypothetical protein